MTQHARHNIRHIATAAADKHPVKNLVRDSLRRGALQQGNIIQPKPGNISATGFNRGRVLLQRPNPAVMRRQSGFNRHRASSGANFQQPRVLLQPQFAGDNSAHLAFGHRHRLFPYMALEQFVRQPHRQIRPGSALRRGVFHQHQAQIRKPPGGNLLRRTAGNAFIRVGKIFAHRQRQFRKVQCLQTAGNRLGRVLAAGENGRTALAHDGI